MCPSDDGVFRQSTLKRYVLCMMCSKQVRIVLLTAVFKRFAITQNGVWVTTKRSCVAHSRCATVTAAEFGWGQLPPHQSEQEEQDFS